MRHIGKIAFWLIVAIALIVVVPYIFLAFSRSDLNGYISWLEITKGEALTYYGAVLAAIATIGAILLTIGFTQKNQREERRLAVRPYLFSTYEPVYDDVSSGNDVYFVEVNPSVISSSRKSSLLTKTYISTGDPHANMMRQLTFKREYHVIKYSLRNIGADSAVDVNFSVGNGPIIPSFGIGKGEQAVFIFILSAELLDSDKYMIAFQVCYKDVASIGVYEQSETIQLYRDFDDSLSTMQKPEWELSAPSQVTKKE